MSRTLRSTLIAAALFLVPAAARSSEEVFVVRTLDDPSVATSCAADENVVLGATIYTPHTDATALVVQSEKVIGTAVACGKILTYTPFDPQIQNPFSIKFNLPNVTVTASGTCNITNLSFPIQGVPAPLLLVGCTLNVNPDSSQGIVRGIATSASVFIPAPIPGYDTGSYWTIHLYLAD